VEAAEAAGPPSERGRAGRTAAREATQEEGEDRKPAASATTLAERRLRAAARTAPVRPAAAEAAGRPDWVE